MLRASFVEEIGGRRVRFALPISGLRKIAPTPRDLGKFTERLIGGECDWDELILVLSAAVGEDADAEAILEEAGINKSVSLAARILVLALTDDGPEDEPGKETAAA